MIYRSSSLLSKNDNALFSVAEMAATPESYLECLLQLNEDCQKAENEYNIAYYRSLKESALNESSDMVLSEGLISKAVEMISKIIEAIINFIKKVIAKLRGSNIKTVVAQTKEFYNNVNKTNDNSPAGPVPAALTNVTKQFTYWHYANWNSLNASIVLDSCKQIIDNIENLCAGNASDAPSSNHLSDALKQMSVRVFNTERVPPNASRKSVSMDFNTGNDFVKFCESVIVFKEIRETTGEEYFRAYGESHILGKSGYFADNEKCLSEVEGKLRKLESILKRTNTGLTPDNVKYAQQYLNYFKECTIAWSEFLTRNEMVQLASAKDFARQIGNKNIAESSAIHGEEFDSNTLFANGDLRDFNRTEWMDLELTAEAYCFNQAINEARRSMAVQEAIIWSENAIPSDTFRKLQAMQEAEINKLANAIQDIIKRVKEFVTKFINDLQDKHGPNAAFMKKYAAQIKNPFKIAEVSSTGNILDGLVRMQESRHISFNPATMNEEDKAAMFKTHFLTGFASKASGGKRPVKWEDGITISDYCKAYYGASMPTDQYPPVKYNTQELNGAKDNIMKFMDAPHAFFSKIKQELSELEKEAKKAGAEAVRPNINVNNTAQTSNNAGQQNANQGGGDNNAASGDAKQESMFYSVLYDRWFNEMDIANGPEAADGDAKGGEGEAKKQNNSKVYIDCLKDILLAKLTAARFIYSECNQLIRAHAKSYMSKEQAAAEAKAEKGNTQNNQQNQQQAQGQQANG